MVTVYDKENGARLGTLTERQLRFCSVNSKRNSRPMPITTSATIEMLEKQGADPTLLEVLARGLRWRDETEIR